MSILIKGMKMPKNCNGCPLFESKYHFHGCLAKPESINNMDMWNFVDDRPTWCPLIEVPPHGRLIDADALRASIRESIDECQKWADEVDKDTMMYARISQSIGTFVECSLRAKAAPTIIEKEE